MIVSTIAQIFESDEITNIEKYNLIHNANQLLTTFLESKQKDVFTSKW